MLFNIDNFILPTHTPLIPISACSMHRLKGKSNPMIVMGFPFRGLRGGRWQLLISIVLLFTLFVSCHNESRITKTKNFEIKDFTPVNNWKEEVVVDSNHVKYLELDYSDAVLGFEIPSVRQAKNGFEYSFQVKNTTKEEQSFYYKIYYQNETYKQPEYIGKNKTTENDLACENFYGSFENIALGFIKTPPIAADGRFHQVEGTIKITGNPRNEKRFYDNTTNSRWKRNPRVGIYSFLLVVSDLNNITNKLIPEYIQNISLPDKDKFVNPYYYFLYGEGQKLNNTTVVKSDKALKVVAKPDLGSGIYIDFHDNDAAAKDFTDNCSRSPEITKSACFQQFLHYVDESTKFKNIPVIKDVVKDDYTLMEYNWNKTFFTKEELIKTWPKLADCACKNVVSDKKEKKITLINPKSTYGDWKKQNAGVITRHGFSYGTYTVKANLTRLLSKSGIWNGIVNTIWLFTQSNDEWNRRRICNKEGYMKTYLGGDKDERVPYTSYSEIDFEILKTVPYCPPYAFPPAYYPAQQDKNNIYSWHTPLPDELESQKEDIVVACTNWDMACWEPDNFGVGCQPISYKDQTFYAHRWDHWYRAIIEKSLEKDAELFGSKHYYFQIEWNPTEIIWRIGPEKDKMHIVGYVNSTITSIPNNQMLLIITQEFHNTKWWPGTPFQQQFIPFPENDIKGEILEVTIE